MKKTATKAVSRTRYEAALKRFSENSGKAKEIITASEKRIGDEMKKRTEKLGSIPEELAEDEAIIMQYCEDNKAALFTDKKTIEAGYGVTVSIKLNPPGLVYGDGVKAEDLLALLKKKDLMDYVNVKESVDARAVIKNCTEDKKLAKVMEQVGVSVEQKETTKVSV